MTHLDQAEGGDTFDYINNTPGNKKYRRKGTKNSNRRDQESRTDILRGET